VSVLFAPGTYYLPEPLAWTAVNGGDPGVPVAFAPATPGGGAVVWSAGLPLTSTLVPGSSDVYNVTLPRARFEQPFVRQLWGGPAGDQRRVITTTPIQQYTALNAFGPGGSNFNVVVAPGTITAPPPAFANAFVRLYHSWTSSVNRVAYWNPANNTLGVGDSVADHYNTASNNRFALENVQPTTGSDLQPGTFWFDPVSFTALYRALPGEDPTVTPLIAPRMSTLLSVTGNVTATGAAGPVVQLNLVNISVWHTASNLEAQCLSYGCCGQSASDMQYAAVAMTGVRQSSLFGVEVAHVGNYALWLHQGCADVSVVYSSFHDLGVGAVRIGEGVSGTAPDPAWLVSNVTVADCQLYDSGYIVEAGAGILLQQATNSTVAHNSIHDLFYTGISTGWTWGYADTSNEGLFVGYNALFNIARGRLSDLGCIYNLGRSPGTVFWNNVCHDVVAAGYGGWGYYDDEVRG
jgi:hypothetical protein